MDEAVSPPPTPVWTRAEAVFATILFVVALAVLAWALIARGSVLPGRDLSVALLFLLYGLFTISIGYQDPEFGYYSFDRVSQVASILVLGALDAAWINGLASLIYPWHRLFKGVPPGNVALASLYNAGLMTLIVLVSGSVYEALGGAVPLSDLSGWSPLLLVVLVVCMQVLNDGGMLLLLWLRRRDLNGFFSGFSYAMELGSGAAAVLVAVVYTASPARVFILLLAVLSAGMLALQRFAAMRQRLEDIVRERTRSLSEKTREFEEQAIRDNLTGLFNRRYADQQLVQQVEAARRHGHPFAVALADIDLFKQINDAHSHAAGDLVLKRVAGILRDRCRKTDMVARYGGDEFLLCFPLTDAGQALALCEQLRASLEEEDWARAGVTVPVTLSFGVAEYRGESAPEALLARADRDLYAAKDGGRNRIGA
ncbi:MAG: GGDEF domain-containing protein [Vicinamibacterales bacterium]